MDNNMIIRAKEKKQLGTANVILELPVNEPNIGQRQRSLPRDLPCCEQTDGQFRASYFKGQTEFTLFGTIKKGTDDPKNVITFTESLVTPVVYRTQEEKCQDPSRLSLDRRNFKTIPIFESEEQLKLLNLQHNCIMQIQNLNPLKRLVFLDLYDNRIEEIYGLENLHSLRVLMLGRNRIHHIAGLESLTKLDVLDLHGNLISFIDNVGHLCHLRVLNLAGNDIAVVEDLSTLHSLTELNLRRNCITHFDCGILPCLKRLFLSHNLIESLDDISSTVLSLSLNELSIDGNPFANNPDHRRLIISYMTHLVTLNQLPENERKEAVQAATREEVKINELQKQLKLMKQRESLIGIVKEEWEARHVNPLLMPGKASYIENEGDVLRLYGKQALEFLKDKNITTVKHLILYYMDFSTGLKNFGLIKESLPNLHTLDCHNINLATLFQLKVLSNSVPHSLVVLNITPDGNPVTDHPFYCSLTNCLLPNVTVNRQKNSEHFSLYRQFCVSQTLIKVDDFAIKQKASTITKTVQYQVHVHHNIRNLFNQIWPQIKNRFWKKACTPNDCD